MNTSDSIFTWLNDRQRNFRTAGRLWVTVSYAQTLDGSITAQRGRPLAISGPQSMALTHNLRANHDAILVGIGTVLADNPRLTARAPDGRLADHQPRPVILDSALRCPPDAAVFQHPLQPWLACAVDAPKEKPTVLGNNAAEFLRVPTSTAGGLDLNYLLKELHRRNIHSLFVEGGAAVISAFLTGRLADGLVVTIAPRLIGGQNAITRQMDIQLKNPAWGIMEQDCMVWGDIG